MNVANLFKRIAFEITFFVVIVITLPLQLLYSTGLVIIALVQQYPPQIHQLLVNLFYGKKDS